ncbi:MAG: roadblock/LC7 domain-containing protein [Promethearchaeota archaeon]
MQVKKGILIPGTSISVKMDLNEETNEIFFLSLKKDKIIDKIPLSNNYLRDILNSFLERNKITIVRSRKESILMFLEEQLFILQEKIGKNKDLDKNYTKNFLQENYNQDINILISGLKNSGKDSIFQVVFEGRFWRNIIENKNKQNINDFKTRNKYVANMVHQFKKEFFRKFKLNIWVITANFKGIKLEENEKKAIFSNITSLIYVIDVNTPNLKENLTAFKTILKNLLFYKNHCPIFVFLHKIDMIKLDNEKQKFLNDIEHYFSIKLEKEIAEWFKIEYFMTSIKDHSIFKVIVQALKKTTPKSNKLNMITQNVKDKIGVYDILILEKRTGFPICSSLMKLKDDTQLAGTTNKIWLLIDKIIKDFDLIKLKQLTLNCENGFLFLEEFAKNLLILILSPSIEILKDKENLKILNEFKEELDKLIDSV